MEPSHSHVRNHERCAAVREILARVGDKWSPRILLTLSGGPLRFSAIKRRMDGISQRMLTFTLRHLERDGYVRRTVLPTVPPRVDYELTALGASLCESIKMLGRWADANLDDIQAARQRFDG